MIYQYINKIIDQSFWKINAYWLTYFLYRVIIVNYIIIHIILFLVKANNYIKILTIKYCQYNLCTNKKCL